MPYTRKATIEEVYNENGLPNIEKLIEIFTQEGRLDPDLAIKILDDAMAIFREEPNMISRDAPITSA